METIEPTEALALNVWLNESSLSESTESTESSSEALALGLGLTESPPGMKEALTVEVVEMEDVKELLAATELDRDVEAVKLGVLEVEAELEAVGV